MTTQTETPKRSTVTFDRTYPATLDEVWELWTTKDGFESWWGPEGFSVKVHELDARPGGLLRYDMIASAPEQIAFMKQAGMPLSSPSSLTYTELTPQTRLGYRHAVDFIPGVTPYNVTTVVAFEAKGDTVRMVVTSDAMHSEEWTKRASMGMESQLNKLTKRFQR
ncbi:SRPBCC family protein [Corallococcus carmarthensis]|uniref:SRPBCC domain-containing protein n=1 Tax=Corallococcus carmarthensis TaxID=2316728 RepID=A0A3A8JWE6_9BACT|nr:SRPBCC domain-containing protein [Corallococcus carmarthensis]NOK20671.1 SRPBCC domain-containing protein [Corallococcus carmarthensis]RKG96584.1 SRPBCC domain-containing protein [Corallococcus carmarthensis]